MAKEGVKAAGRGGSAAVFLFPVIGLLAVGNVVFALLWLLNPLASGPAAERGGRRIEVRTGRRVLKIAEGVSAEGPSAGFEARLPAEQFEELNKTLAQLALAARSGEQAAEFFQSDAGRDVEPAVTLAFPRRGVGTESLEVYVIDMRRQACYCRLGSTGEPLTIKLDVYQKIASELAQLAGGAAGNLAVPYYTPIGEAVTAQLAKLQGPMMVTTVSSDPRQYLIQMLSNPLVGASNMQLQQPDRSTLTISLRLPDDQGMTRGLADAMARASDKVKVQHLDFATQAAAVQEFARSLKRALSEIEDSLVLQYAGRVRIIRSTELLASEPGSPLSPATPRFDGEKVVAQALEGLLSERGLLYFAGGHGERRMADRALEGLSQLADQLGARGFRATALDLAAAKAVPGDCHALVVAGPRKPYDADLEKALAAYLDGGGRLALLLDPPDGPAVLADYLKRFGITAPDPKKVLEVPGRLNPPVAIELELNAKLDFVQRWTREATVYFTATELAVTPPAEDADFEVFRVARPAEADEGAKAPCLIAAARPKPGKKGPKLLVFSDVDAFTNQLVRQVPTNAQLFADALTWLAE